MSASTSSPILSSPSDRDRKWTGLCRALKPGGLLIVEGYTPRQLQYDTGGPKQIENLYTAVLSKQAFRDFHDLKIVEEEVVLHEGTSTAGCPR